MKTEARQGLSGIACPVSLADIALFAPSRVLLCPINTIVYRRAFVLSFPMSPSSLLAVTSRYSSYAGIPPWLSAHLQSLFWLSLNRYYIPDDYSTIIWWNNLASDWVNDDHIIQFHQASGWSWYRGGWDWGSHRQWPSHQAWCPSTKCISILYNKSQIC